MTIQVKRQRSHNLRATSMTLDALALEELDRLVIGGHFLNRSDAVDQAIQMLLSVYRNMPIVPRTDDADAA